MAIIWTLIFNLNGNFQISQLPNSISKNMIESSPNYAYLINSICVKCHDIDAHFRNCNPK